MKKIQKLFLELGMLSALASYAHAEPQFREYAVKTLPGEPIIVQGQRELMEYCNFDKQIKRLVADHYNTFVCIKK